MQDMEKRVKERGRREGGILNNLNKRQEKPGLHTHAERYKRRKSRK
jgi:hypothetical protein